MSNQKPIFLPLDMTASVMSNRIENEQHALPATALKLIKPEYSPFYSKDLSVVLIDESGNSVTLNNKADYQCIDIVTDVTKVTGFDVYRFILITRQNTTGIIRLSYRALGGQQNGSAPQTLQAANDALATDVRVPWSEVHDKPNGFTPKAHPQDVEDLYGMEYLKDAISGIRTDILNTVNSRKIGLNSATQALIKEWMLLRITPFVDLINHQKNYNNTHILTKDQVGLPDVENVSLCTPFSLKKLLSSDEKTNQLGHLSEYNNPHTLTKEQVGLGDVMDYATAIIDNTTTNYAADAYVVVSALMTAVQNLLSPYLRKSSLDIASGVAKLNSAGKVPTTLIPAELGYTCADIYDYFVSKPSTGQVIFSITTLRNPHCVLLLKRSVMTCSVSATAPSVFTVLKNNTQIGQFVFSAGSTESVYTSDTGTYMEKLLPGDLLQVRAPSVVDATLAGIGIGLMAGVPV